jgi:hypothetical protein
MPPLSCSSSGAVLQKISTPGGVVFYAAKRVGRLCKKLALVRCDTLLSSIKGETYRVAMGDAKKKLEAGKQQK